MNARIGALAILLMGGLMPSSGCGGAQPAGQAAYDAGCKVKQNVHRRAVSTRNYQPPELLVYQWPGDDEGSVSFSRPSLLHEADLVARLRTGKARKILLTGASGVGKSTFARAIDSLTCSNMPVAAVNLAWGLTPSDAAPLATAVARALGVTPGANAKTALQTHFGDDAALFLLDAFDELPTSRRVPTAKMVDALATALPQARIVVLSRPPVFGPTMRAFGGFDARLALPTSKCAKIDWHVMIRQKAGWEKRNYEKFLTDRKLNRKITTGHGCRYTYMPTYRDLDMVWDLAQPSGDKLLAADFATGFKGARATLLEHHIKRSLLHAFESTPFRPSQALTLIDHMFAAAGGPGEGSQTFDRAGCVQAFIKAKLNEGGAIQPGAFCKRILASDLFAGQGKRRHFASRAHAEYITARWLDGQLQTPTGPKCEQIANHKGLLESNEVASMLIGLPAGGLCLAQVVQQLCTSDMPAAHVVSTLRRGLPGGEHRIEYLGHAEQRVPTDAPGGACVERVLNAASSE